MISRTDLKLLGKVSLVAVEGELEHFGEVKPGGSEIEDLLHGCKETDSSPTFRLNRWFTIEGLAGLFKHTLNGVKAVIVRGFPKEFSNKPRACQNIP